MGKGEKLFGSVYFAIFGIIVMVFGVAELVAFTTGGITWENIEMSGTFLAWEAVILLSAGLLYLSSVKNFAEISQLAKTVLASMMVWIVAGAKVWARIAGSIPGGEDGPWFNTFEDFLASYAPPYCPELFLLPFSLVVIYYIIKAKAE